LSAIASSLPKAALATASERRPVDPTPTTVAEARGSGANAPRITSHPYIGVLAVFLGLMTQTINGRLVSVGLADLRGALGFGFDEASWIPTALNMGIIFTGVFSVFLASAYGIRRVLLVSGAIFMLTSFALPFSPTLNVMLALMVISGLSSGSFYSLTMTFVARNLPPKLIIFGIAAYALDVVVTNNMAASIEGFYIEYFSWHWIFWTAAVLMPLVMICLHFGIPSPPRSASAGSKPSWRGFLYVGLGLSFTYAALDQGQRLDWFNSGLIVGLFAAAFVLFISAAVRRYFQPNPFVNLPFLNARNIIILGLGIFFIRFSLLASLVMIPGFLANIQQYRPLQTGHALAWVAAPQFVLVWLAAIALVFIPPRIVMAAGFSTIAVACWMASHVDSSWSGNSFQMPELTFALGVGVAFVALVTNLVLLALETGAVKDVANMSTYSGWLHTMRLLGGQIGTVIFTRFLDVREKWHSNLLGQYVEPGNWLTVERLNGLGAALTPSSAGASDGQARAVGVLSSQVRAQAYTLASSEAFMLIAWAIVGYLVLLLFLRPSTINLRQAGKAQ
jgi:MFS transporter, DHA2 family, multidrug resistance protein